jgi:SAM-dependent methyltransferase
MGLSSERDSKEQDWYLSVIRDNLLLDIEDPTRNKDLLDGIATIEIKNVLDVGCGIGQALFPLAVSKNAFGVGVDISEKACRIGKEFYAAHIPDARVVFLCSKAESLPFASESFDVVNCNLVLPYTKNYFALSEFSRVLRPRGLLLLKIHHARFYLNEFWRGLISFDVLSLIHSLRVLVAGTIYHITSRQPLFKPLNETFQTRWLLVRELSKVGLEIEREQTNSNPLTPSFVIIKKC